MKHTTYILVGVALAGCTSELDSGTDNTALPPGSTTGGEDTTFDHENDGISPWELIDRLTKEGPPRYTSRVHSCPKVKYETVGAVLRSVGVNTANNANVSAGRLYRDGANAMGVANYPNRIRENISLSTSGASRLFDVFAAAAPEVIAAVPTLTRCQTNGTPAQLFNGNTCVASGITCLIGVPAQPAHLDICNQTISSASTPQRGQEMAVALLLAAAYTCE